MLMLRRRGWRCRRALIPCVALCLGAGGAAEAPTGIEWERERLSVTAEGTPLTDILGEIARRTGVEFRGVEAIDEPTFVRFADLPLQEALRRLLARVNYVIVTDPTPDGRTPPALVLIAANRRRGPGETVQSEGRDARGHEAMAGASGPDGDPDMAELPHGVAAGDETALGTALFDPDPALRATVLDLLARRDRHKVVNLLVEATKSGDPMARLQALELLQESGQAEEETVLSALGSALADPDPDVKSYAIATLPERLGYGALLPLYQAFSDPDVSIRILVVETALRVGGVRLLQEATRDTHDAVRALAEYWLERGISEEGR